MSINSVDLSLFSFINQTLSNDFFDWIMPYIRNKTTWIPLYIILSVSIYKKNSRDFLLLALCIVLALIFSDSIISNNIKTMVHRTRPCDDLFMIDHLHLLLKKCSGGFSFPSAHACNHATLAIIFGQYFINRQHGWVICIIFILWALTIAFAQVYVGVHYPSDVLVGLVIGSLNGIFFYYLYNKAIIYFYNQQKQFK